MTEDLATCETKHSRITEWHKKHLLYINVIQMLEITFYTFTYTINNMYLEFMTLSIQTVISNLLDLFLIDLFTHVS